MKEFQLPENLDFKKFQELANGFFQGEGYIGCRVRDTGGKPSFLPVFTMNQNLNEKSLLFFVTLWHILGRSCSLYIETSSSGKLIIVIRSEDWNYILDVVCNYFTMTYGENLLTLLNLLLFDLFVYKILKRV